MSRRPASRRPSRALLLTAVGAALGTAGPSALGAYLVASAVDVGIGEGTAGLLAALGERAEPRRARDRSAPAPTAGATTGSRSWWCCSRPARRLRADVEPRRRPSFVLGALVAFTLGWGWPGLFNLAVVDRNRETPGSASGVSQTGIYVGAALGPAAFGALRRVPGYGTAWPRWPGSTLLVGGRPVARAPRADAFAPASGV